MTVNETTIPADAIVGLLVGWTGPVEYRDALGEWGPTCCDNGRWPGAAVHMDPDRIRLDCLRPEVQARIGGVLAAGVRCDHDYPQWPQRANMSGHEWTVCSRCGAHTSKGEAGWTRKPSPIWHILDAVRTGALSDQHIAEAVAWSVRSVARGGEVLKGWVPEWSIHDGEGYNIGVRGAIDDRFCVVSGTDRWALYIDGKAAAAGPETGPEGRACADRAALAHNFALLNDDGSVTTPELSTETK